MTELSELQRLALEVRDRYDAHERSRFGRAWTDEELMLGFVGDVGDLAKLVQGKAGVRPRDDLDEALAHELADLPLVGLGVGRSVRRRSERGIPRHHGLPAPAP